MKKIITAFLISLITISAFSQWAQVPSPTTQRLYDIMFADSLTGFISGFDVILRTHDGGSTWDVVHSSTHSEPIAEIYFPSDNVGYAVSDYHILKTVDGGDSWYFDNSPDYHLLRGVYFLNPDTGFVCGLGQAIYRTINGGFSWIRQTEGPYWLRRFDFPSLDIGYCVGDGHTIYKTYDGGRNWIYLMGESGPNLTDVQFLSPEKGFICGLDGYVAVTNDGGYSWDPVFTGTSLAFEGLFALDPQSIYVFGENGTILRTNDGGASWTQDISGTDNTLREAFFLANKGFAVGYNGTILTNTWCTKAMFSASIDSLTVTFTDESECAGVWYWSFGDGYFSNLQFPVHSYDSAGLYTVCLTVTDTLVNYSDIYCEEILITSVSEQSGAQILKIYPNPCTDYFILPSDRGNPLVLIEIFDIRGKRVLMQEMQNAGNAGMKVIFNLPEGFYVVVVTQEDGGRRVGKVMVNGELVSW